MLARNSNTTDERSLKPERTLKTINILAFGSGDLYGGGSFFIIGTFTLYYLIRVAGLSPALAGLVIGLGKIFDAVSDPLMGWITDRTKPGRFGRRRVFLVVGIIPVALTFALLWLPVRFNSQAGQFLYYCMAYIAFYCVFTMVMVPYSALAADMTKDYKTRNRLSGSRIVFSLVSTLLAGIFAQTIINASGDQALGHFYMGLVFAIFFALPWIAVVVGTWESKEVSVNNNTGNIISNFISMFRNRSFKILIGIYICSYAAMDCVMAWLKFYLLDYLAVRPNSIPLFLGAILLAEISTLPLYVFITNKKGNGVSYIIGMLVWAFGMVLLAIQSPNSPTIILVANCALIGFGLSAGVFVPWSLLPFVADVDELITAKQRAGTYSGGMTLIRKLVQGAFVIPIMGLLLGLIGYTSHATDGTLPVQSSDTLTALKSIFIAVPFAFIVAGIVIATFLKITPERHKILRAEIERLRLGGRLKEADEETKKVCEILSGIDFGTLHGRSE
jgi:oligogalacturonide transporter